MNADITLIYADFYVYYCNKKQSKKYVERKISVNHCNISVHQRFKKIIKENMQKEIISGTSVI